MPENEVWKDVDTEKGILLIHMDVLHQPMDVSIMIERQHEILVVVIDLFINLNTMHI